MPTVLNPKLSPVASEFNPVLGSKLIPAATEFYPNLRHRHGTHADRYDTRVSEYQIRRAGSSGRCRLGRLHPPRETKAQGEYHDRRDKQKSAQKEKVVRRIRSKNGSKRGAKQGAKVWVYFSLQLRRVQGSSKWRPTTSVRCPSREKNETGHAKVVDPAKVSRGGMWSNWNAGNKEIGLNRVRCAAISCLPLRGGRVREVG